MKHDMLDTCRKVLKLEARANIRCYNYSIFGCPLNSFCFQFSSLKMNAIVQTAS